MPIYDNSASNDIALRHSTTGTDTVFNTTSSSDLALSQVLSAAGSEYHPLASNDVGLDSGNLPYDIEIPVITELLFNQASWDHFKDIAAANDLVLEQILSAAGSDFSVSVENTIVFHQAAQLLINISASNDITFSDEAGDSWDAENNIAFTCIATAICGWLVTSDLSFTQEAIGNASRDLSVSHDIAFSSQAFGLVNEEENQYAPINASGSSVPDSLTLTQSDVITLTAGVYSLELRAPDFGNTEALNTNRLIRESRGGTLNVHKFTPSKTTLSYTHSMISAATLALYEAFVSNTLGQTITLVDYDSRTWTGILFPGDMAQVRPTWWQISFSFIGELT